MRSPHNNAVLQQQVIVCSNGRGQPLSVSVENHDALRIFVGGRSTNLFNDTRSLGLLKMQITVNFARQTGRRTDLSLQKLLLIGLMTQTE
jgi:hypothetical protein